MGLKTISVFAKNQCSGGIADRSNVEAANEAFCGKAPSHQPKSCLGLPAGAW